jgi:hypothetical protein
MKKLITLSISIALTGAICFSQTVITHATHALLNGADNPMSYCEFMEPGNSGSNITWDYSGLQFKNAFTGFLTNSQLTENGAAFPQSNTELAEFNSRFYFNVNENQIEQYGYSSADGRSRIYYETPFIKMKYPLAFGDIFSGNFTGTYEYANVPSGTLSGSYLIEADAFGTLILPGGKQFESTLRIKTVKEYQTVFSNMTQEVNIVTYRWYNQTHRYPLLVLTEYTTTVGDNVSVNYQAAYNSDAVNYIAPMLAESILLFPNPASSALTLEMNTSFSGSLAFELFDASGKLTRKFSREVPFPGSQSFNLSEEIKGLQPATYMMVISNGKDRITRNFTIKPH